MSKEKLKILVLYKYYAPGYQAGGTVRSLVNMIENLSSRFNFFVITGDRDIGAKCSYSDIPLDSWTELSGAHVYYATRKNRGFIGVLRQLRKINPDVLYLNSFYDIRLTLWPLVLLRLHIIQPNRTIIAPQGVFTKGAKSIRGRRKQLYFYFAKCLSLFKGVIWRASSKQEKNQIIDSIGGCAEKIVVASDLPTQTDRDGIVAISSPSSQEKCKVLFLSRICEIKNLKFLLEVIKICRHSIELTIGGPVEDRKYWHECQMVIAQLPEHIKVKIVGFVEPGEVSNLMANSHLFFLPTLGENYGHVISEALSAGTPVLISDRTVWTEAVNRGAGKALPLNHPLPFAQFIDKIATMPDPRYIELREQVAAIFSEESNFFIKQADNVALLMGELCENTANATQK